MDPLRADQAAEEVAQGFQDLIQTKLTFMNQRYPELFPWKTLAEVPADKLNNMDEISSNGKNNREKKISTDTMLNFEWMRIANTAQQNYIKRLFEVTSGDNGDKLGHRTIVLTSRGDGKFQEKSIDADGEVMVTDGACAPVIIDEYNPGKSKSTRGPTEVTSDMTANIYDAQNNSPTGIKVRIMISRSFSKIIIFTSAIPFLCCRP